MISWLLHWLKEHHGFAHSLPLLTRMALAAITALLLVVFCGKPFIRQLYAWKIGERIRKEECPLLGTLHSQKQDTPTMGGILILFSLLAALLLWMDLRSPFTLILAATTLFFGAIGGYDDYLKLRYKNKKGLPGRAKMALQLLFSFGIAGYLLLSAPDHALPLYLPFLKEPLALSPTLTCSLLLLLIPFVITGSSNAVNLTDGLDGLAAGTVTMAAGAFAVVAFLSSAHHVNLLPVVEGSAEVAIYLSAMVGASLGFLWYNGYPAQIFMGDIGSLPLGALLGVSAVLLRREGLLALIGGVFVAEALSVILQVGSFRWRNQRRIFLCTPLHHHFEYQGWAEAKVVVRFWMAGLLCALLGLVSVVV